MRAHTHTHSWIAWSSRQEEPVFRNVGANAAAGLSGETRAHLLRGTQQVAREESGRVARAVLQQAQAPVAQNVTMGPRVAFLLMLIFGMITKGACPPRRACQERPSARAPSHPPGARAQPYSPLPPWPFCLCLRLSVPIRSPAHPTSTNLAPAPDSHAARPTTTPPRPYRTPCGAPLAAPASLFAIGLSLSLLSLFLGAGYIKGALATGALMWLTNLLFPSVSRCPSADSPPGLARCHLPACSTACHTGRAAPADRLSSAPPPSHRRCCGGCGGAQGWCGPWRAAVTRCRAPATPLADAGERIVRLHRDAVGDRAGRDGAAGPRRATTGIDRDHPQRTE